MNRIALVLSLSLLCATRAEASPCTSQWMKFRAQFAALGPLVGKMICDYTANGDADAAQDCVDAYEEAVRVIKDLEKAWNQNATSAAIGPRGMAANRSYTGTVTAERVFIGGNVNSDKWKLDFEITGGNSTKDLTVDVCLIDAKGDAAGHQSKKFTAPPKAGTKWAPKLKNAAGLIPMVYLRKPLGTKGFKYRLVSKPGKKEPKAIRDARNDAKKGNSKKKGKGKGKTPSPRR